MKQRMVVRFCQLWLLMCRSLIGTAPDASYYLFRTEDVRSETLVEEMNWLAAAEYDSLECRYHQLLIGVYVLIIRKTAIHTRIWMRSPTIITKAADWAASKGVWFLNSAGNYANMGVLISGCSADWIAFWRLVPLVYEC